MENALGVVEGAVGTVASTVTETVGSAAPEIASTVGSVTDVAVSSAEVGLQAAEPLALNPTLNVLERGLMPTLESASSEATSLALVRTELEGLRSSEMLEVLFNLIREANQSEEEEEYVLVRKKKKEPFVKRFLKSFVAGAFSGAIDAGKKTVSPNNFSA